ncbi:MAG TPA: amidohydrolase family protein [Acidobacteriota bacterium]|nr:amidohydrolase family protein [Acidobacteriota bacterium]
MKSDLWVRGGQVVIPGHGVCAMDVVIHQGKVLGVFEPGQRPDASRVLDVSEKIVLPGVVDAHTHITIGLGETGYETETRSASLGGVTTTLSYLLDPGNLAQALEREIATGQERACSDFGLHPCIMTDVQIKALAKVIDRFHVPSFKFFMVYRGEEGAHLGIPGNDDGFLLKLLRTAATLPGVIPCVHAENVELFWMLRPEVERDGEGSLKDWERSRPDFVEADATQRVLYLAEKVDSPLYVVHVTCREALNMVRRAKVRRPGKVFAETCIHYLTLTCETAPSPAGKISPPLRHPDDVESLWEGVADGTIDVIASDHVPRHYTAKEGDIWQASSGFPGIATLVPILLTEGVKRGLPLEVLVEKITTAPATIFGLAPSKGSFIPRSDGDLTVVDPVTPVEIAATRLASAAEYTPYEGHVVKYVPTYTVIRGNVVVDNGQFVGKSGFGTYIPRNRYMSRSGI